MKPCKMIKKIKNKKICKNEKEKKEKKKRDFPHNIISLYFLLCHCFIFIFNKVYLSRINDQTTF